MINFHNDHSNCNSVRRSFGWFSGFYNDIMAQYGAILNGHVNDTHQLFFLRTVVTFINTCLNI